ncbi:MAG: CocE/NonD family hydrolase [Nitrospinota bacterium]|nr:CocE/NonD family hydrolase [Nitrospinota bacterium]
MNKFKTDIKDGMRIDWDVPVTMDDGVILRCDIYRPVEEGKYPALLSYGPYGKYLHFEDGYETAWKRMVELHPDVPAGSSNKYQSWEVVDPEKWVSDGYVVVRFDSRGSGRSPGYIDHFSARETKDFYDCIEWSAIQPWCNGKIGLTGISYYAMNQWQVSALHPPHLAAICIWEGAADYYRDMGHHGGIHTTFLANWYDMQSKTVQHGVGTKGYRSRMNGELVAGPLTLSEEELAANRSDYGEDIRTSKLSTDDYWEQRIPDWSKIEVPLLSSANWGGQGLHPRGNFEGYINAASKEKWIEVHGIEHWTEFYTDYGVNLQKKFFGHYLKGEDTGWKNQPNVLLQIRHPGEKFVEREENEWPLARTNWTKFYLDPVEHALSEEENNSNKKITYAGFSDGATFVTPPLEKETEITGPSAAKLFISSETEDADLFLVLRVFTEDFKEVVFQGALDPHTPIAQGWLRASHRKLDPELSLPYRPYHAHDEIQPLTPNEIYELDVEIWPTCIVVPKGYRIALSVRGKDYIYPGGADSGLSNMKNVFTGCGPFLHNDPRDRPANIFGGNVTLHFDEGKRPYVLLPIIP